MYILIHPFLVGVACFCCDPRQTAPSLLGRLFDSETGLWTDLPPVNAKRARYPGTVAIEWGAGHRIYMVGGGMKGAVLDTCEFIGVGDDQWTLLDAKMFTPRTRGRAIMLDDTTIVVCGGENNDENSLASCESLDLATHTFSAFPDMLEPRYSPAGVHYNGTVVVIGGTYGQKMCEQFDPAVFKWTPFAPIDCNDPIEAVVVEDKIYAIDVYSASVWEYDGAAWVVVMASFLCKYRPAIAALGGKIAVITWHSTNVDVFDPATKLWSCLPTRSLSRTELFAVSF